RPPFLEVRILRTLSPIMFNCTSSLGICVAYFDNTPLVNSPGLGFLKNQKEVRSVAFRRVEPALLADEAEAIAGGVFTDELSGNAMVLEIVLSGLAGLGWAVNDGQ